jgi:hypothetical protein
VKQHLDNTGSVWKFNSPHSSERRQNFVSECLFILLQKNSIKYPTCDSDHPFPHSTHVGRVWGIELPN